jgi:N-methylhydantoinase A
VQDRVPPGQATVRWSSDMRYDGQSYELEVPLAIRELSDATVPDLVHAFHQQHEQVYGHANPGNRIEFVNLRSVHSFALERPQVTRPDERGGEGTGDEPCEERAVYFDEYRARVATAVYRRDRLSAGMTIDGPAIIEQADTTTVVYPRWRARIDGLGNIRMALKAEQPTEGSK